MKRSIVMPMNEVVWSFVNSEGVARVCRNGEMEFERIASAKRHG